MALFEPTAKFVREAGKAGLNAELATVSFVGTENLIDALAQGAEGPVISQVVPSPDNQQVALITEYRAALDKVTPGAKSSLVSLEGYLVGRVIVAG